MNNYKELVKNLYLSVITPADKKSDEYLIIARGIANKLKPAEVEKAKKELEIFFKVEELIQ